MPRTLSRGPGLESRRSQNSVFNKLPDIPCLKLPPSLFKCLATTNVIESPQGGVARRTGNVTRRRDQEMVERWVASARLLTEKHFRKIDGHRDLWALAAILGASPRPQRLQEKVA